MAELMRIGKGYFSKSLGNFTTASHCKPICPDLKAEIIKKKKRQAKSNQHKNKRYMKLLWLAKFSH